MPSKSIVHYIPNVPHAVVWQLCLKVNHVMCATNVRPCISGAQFSVFNWWWDALGRERISLTFALCKPEALF